MVYDIFTCDEYHSLTQMSKLKQFIAGIYNMLINF